MKDYKKFLSKIEKNHTNYFYKKIKNILYNFILNNEIIDIEVMLKEFKDKEEIKIIKRLYLFFDNSMQNNFKFLTTRKALSLKLISEDTDIYFIRNISYFDMNEEYVYDTILFNQYRYKNKSKEYIKKFLTKKELIYKIMLKRGKSYNKFVNFLIEEEYITKKDIELLNNKFKEDIDNNLKYKNSLNLF